MASFSLDQLDFNKNEQLSMQPSEASALCDELVMELARYSKDHSSALIGERKIGFFILCNQMKIIKNKIIESSGPLSASASTDFLGTMASHWASFRTIKSSDVNQIKIPLGKPAAGYKTFSDFENDISQYIKYIESISASLGIQESHYISMVYLNAPADSNLGLFIAENIYNTNNVNSWANCKNMLIKQFSALVTKETKIAKVLQATWNYTSTYNNNKTHFLDLLSKAELLNEQNSPIIKTIFINFVPKMLLERCLTSNPGLNVDKDFSFIMEKMDETLQNYVSVHGTEILQPEIADVFYAGNNKFNKRHVSESKSSTSINETQLQQLKKLASYSNICWHQYCNNTGCSKENCKRNHDSNHLWNMFKTVNILTKPFGSKNKDVKE